MNRREFLKGLVATTATLKTSGASAIIADDFLFKNLLYKIEFMKPLGWVYKNVEDFKLLSELSDHKKDNELIELYH